MSRFARFAAPVISIALLVIGLSGCSGANLSGPAASTAPGLPTAATTTPTTTTKAKAADVDYRRLLLTGPDFSDADDTFNPRSNDPKPTGLPGASAFFVNDKDTRAISDTLMIYPNAAAASDALRQATGSLTSQVTGGAPSPAPVGTDGVTISGSYPNDKKAVTLLFFTEGPALARLEFQSATGDATTERYVTSVGKMQQIALRVGLPSTQ